MEEYPLHWPQFYAATILEWKPLLKPGKYKEIIVSSLQYLTINKKITLYAFVILPGNTPEKIQASFMKFTAHQIKLDLVANYPWCWINSK